MGTFHISLLIPLAFLITFEHSVIAGDGVNFYNLLQVGSSADRREIRKAFKKLAITMHPDKIQDDPEAQEKFLKLKHAYDILKDQETRKQYDLHGEDGVKDDGYRSSKEYQNWHFYKDHFGNDDEDPEIITLSAADFEQCVKNSIEYWFVKFYSPMCSHCHMMATNWRMLANDLNAVIKIAAVNCEEEWVHCRKEGISSYPSLVLYPSKEKYYGERTAEDMETFVLHKLPVQPAEISSYKVLKSTLEEEALQTNPWLFIFCKDSSDSNCPSWQSRAKLANILDGLVSVAYIDCSSKDISCSKLGYQSATVYLTAGNATLQEGIEIHSLNYLKIAAQVLEQLPDDEILDQEGLEAIHEQLKEYISTDWFIYFTETSDSTSFSTLQRSGSCWCNNPGSQ